MKNEEERKENKIIRRPETTGKETKQTTIEHYRTRDKNEIERERENWTEIESRWRASLRRERTTTITINVI